MAKFLFAVSLLLAVAYARNMDMQRQSGNNRRPQNGNIGDRQGSNTFGQAFPGGQGRAGFPGNNGGHGFPEQQGLSGYGQPPIPPFLSNVTQEALEELQSILKNEELTKAEVESQMQEWAKTQGDEIAQQFEEMQAETKQKEEEMKEKIIKTIKNVKELIEKICSVESNMEITVADEKEEIKALLADQPRSVTELIMMLENAAKIEAMGVPEAPEVPEGATEVPAVKSALRGFKGF